MQVGDSCELGRASSGVHSTSVAEPWRPAFGEASEDGSLWTVHMLQGPQAAPDYFTEADMEVIPPPPLLCLFYLLFASLFPDHPATLHALSRSRRSVVATAHELRKPRQNYESHYNISADGVRITETAVS